MKSKALLTAVLLAASNFAWANGGITPDNFEQYLKVDNGVATADTNQVRSSSSFDLNKLGKPSTGPVYRGESSNQPVYFNLSDIGKPSNGPSYDDAS